MGTTRAPHRNSKAWLIVWSVLALLGLLSSYACTAVAAQETRGTGEESSEYRALIREALQEFDRGNWEEAGALFARAHAIEPNARTLRGMGVAAFEARHYVDALRNLKAALADSRQALTASQRKEVEQTIAKTELYIGRIALSLEPANASVRVDGQLVELGPGGELVADVGLLELEIAAPEYETLVRRVRVAPGTTEALTIALKPARSADATNTDALRDASADAPSAPPAADAGEGDSSALTTWKWVAGGTALAAVAIGVTTLVMANAAADDWNACRDPELKACRSDYDRSKSLRTVGIVSLASGAAIGALATVMFVLDGQATPESSARGCSPAFDLGIACHIAF